MLNKSNTIWREFWVFRCCDKHFPLTLSWKCTHWQESAWDILVNMLLLIFIVILGWTFSVCVCECCAFSVHYEIWANPFSSPHHPKSGLFFLLKLHLGWSSVYSSVSSSLSSSSSCSLFCLADAWIVYSHMECVCKSHGNQISLIPRD